MSAVRVKKLTQLDEAKNGKAQHGTPPSAGIDMLIQNLKKELVKRGGNGFLALQRKFRLMDDDGSKTLSMGEFRKAMKELSLGLTEADIRNLFEHFDADKSEAIDFEEFIQGIREPLSERRLRLVNMAFKIIDRDDSGSVDVDELAKLYDGSGHPEVVSGRKKPTEVLREFLSAFDVGGVKDGMVTKQEFTNYYANIGASIDNDDYFELMIRNAWHISGGEGAAANSANRRVLVTRADGSQHVQEIGNDLGVGARDKAGLAARLQAHGVEAANIDLYGTGEDNGKISMRLGTRPTTSPQKRRAPKPASAAAADPGIGHLITKIKAELKARGSGGFVGLQRRFRIMDDDGSKSLSLPEFKKALSDFKLNLTEADLRAVFSHFDSDGSGSIDFEEFVQGVRDPPSARRLRLVEQAFGVIDRDGSGVVDAQEVAAMYDASKHPEVIARRKTATQVLTEFLDTFDVGGVKDGMVTKQEFANYCANIGASIDNDDYFELMIRNAWHLSGGEGATANSSNLRVLVTDSSGRERSVVVLNDLGLRRDDLTALYTRLKAQGEKDIWAINGTTLQISVINGQAVVQAGGPASRLEPVSVKLPQLDRLPRVKGAQSFTASPSKALLGSSSNLLSPVSGANHKQGIAQPASPLRQMQAQLAKEQQEMLVVSTLLDVLRVQLLSRGAAGIIALQRGFADMDTDGSRSLEYAEFRQALLADKLAFSEHQLGTLFNYFDVDRSGAIDYDELLHGLRGQLSAPLSALVQRSGAIPPTLLLAHFDASRHPEVQGWGKSAEQVQRAACSRG